MGLSMLGPHKYKAEKEHVIPMLQHHVVLLMEGHSSSQGCRMRTLKRALDRSLKLNWRVYFVEGVHLLLEADFC